MNVLICVKKSTQKIYKNVFGAGGHDERLWLNAWTSIKTIVDTEEIPFLILDKDLRVTIANDSFYSTFHVQAKDTEHTLVYNLGNGQWNIPSLRGLLTDIVLKHTFFKGFETTRNFPGIGQKVMLLSAREIYRIDETLGVFPTRIFLVIENITDMVDVAHTISQSIHGL